MCVYVLSSYSGIKHMPDAPVIYWWDLCWMVSNLLMVLTCSVCSFCLHGCTLLHEKSILSHLTHCMWCSAQWSWCGDSWMWWRLTIAASRWSKNSSAFFFFCLQRVEVTVFLKQVFFVFFSLWRKSRHVRFKMSAVVNGPVISMLISQTC